MELAHHPLDGHDMQFFNKWEYWQHPLILTGFIKWYSMWQHVLLTWISLWSVLRKRAIPGVHIESPCPWHHIKGHADGEQKSHLANKQCSIFKWQAKILLILWVALVLPDCNQHVETSSLSYNNRMCSHINICRNMTRVVFQGFHVCWSKELWTMSENWTVDSRKSLLCILACHQPWKTSCILRSEVSKTGSLKRQQIEMTLLSAPKILGSLSKRRLSLITWVIHDRAKALLVIENSCTCLRRRISLVAIHC